MLVKNFSNLEDEQNAHLQGLKKVFIKSSDTESSLTQFAFGKLESHHVMDIYSHKTMDEYFFILNGEGLVQLGEEELSIKKDTFIRIPAGVQHRLLA